jgi:hypothetical protein
MMKLKLREGSVQTLYGGPQASAAAIREAWIKLSMKFGLAVKYPINSSGKLLRFLTFQSKSNRNCKMALATEQLMWMIAVMMK